MGLDDRDYHIQRARDELVWAFRTHNEAAATSHRRLSALHMERACEEAAAPSNLDSNSELVSNKG